MVRVYKRKPGVRNYRTGYSNDELNSAVAHVESGNMSLRKAAEKYHIPVGTLHNKLKKAHAGKVGGQFRLLFECEKEILKSIDVLSEWKCPLTGYDVQLLVKNYLDRQGVVDKTFNWNFPGEDWLSRFTKRYELTKSRCH